jgi:hypothetical protein
MKKVSYMGLMGLMAASQFAIASDSMIEIIEEHGTATPFVNERGDTMTATVVAIRQPDAETLELQPVEVTESGIRAHSTMSVRLSAPQIISASWGVVFGTKKCMVRGDIKEDCYLDGLLMQIEPGLGGLKGSVGIAKISSAPEALRGMMELPISAMDLKASAFRTWDLSTLAATGPFSAAAQTYAGLEGDINVSMVKFSLGLLKKLDGGGPDWLLTGGVGYGF